MDSILQRIQDDGFVIIAKAKLKVPAFPPRQSLYFSPAVDSPRPRQEESGA